MPQILVIGGAGYIGSHMVKLLLRSGFGVTVLDDLSGGFADAVPDGLLVQGSIADTALLERLFVRQRFDAVMHFASFIAVGESVTDPAKYYGNNVAATLTLIDAMRAAGVMRFIFRRRQPSMATRSTRPSTNGIPSNRSIPMAAASG